ncbi:unnamed protein product [Cylindrotheca closterium]|uniref:Uncharacterized protein n=1 Tax=Cylindrotheca closterium TaxID=2856 RepID=A0AAD2JH03_9STRA|nr:unnamed protein product [Cylindrotheca closterium]
MEVTEYQFQGIEGETVPNFVLKLIVNPGIRELPRYLCANQFDLQEVSLPEGLIKIGHGAFDFCCYLTEIKICSTIESIGEAAFVHCKRLAKVEFEYSSSSPHQIKAIGKFAFSCCVLLQRVKIPSSLKVIGNDAFHACKILIEADLSTTSIAEIPHDVFLDCRSLQTVSLPKSLELIGQNVFHKCTSLVTVMVPVESHAIELEGNSIGLCNALANIVLPKWSIANKEYFDKCTLLQDRFGKEADDIGACLTHRFDNFPLHRICYYYNSSAAALELCDCIQKTKEEEESPLVDRFGMTPFHVLCSTIGPSQDLLQVLLDKLPHYVLGWRDANDNMAMNYLVNNWTDENKILLQKVLQSWIFSRLEHWCSESGRRRMIPLVNAVLAEDDKERRITAFVEACSVFAQYEGMEATSILEMTLWKGKVNHEWSNDGSNRRALEREESRFVCGSSIVMPSVMMFLTTARR